MHQHDAQKSRYAPPAMNPWKLLIFLILAAVAGCAFAGSQSPRVVPTAPIHSADDVPGEIGVHALVVAYAGATGASASVTRDKKAAADRAALLANTARSGDETFSSLVTSYSDHAPLVDPGPVGARLSRDSKLLPAVAVDAAFRLEPLAISDPIETDIGYVIVMRTADPPEGPTQVSARHILVSYKGAQRAPEAITRSKEEARARAEQLLVEVRKQDADWVTIAQDNTDEPGARNGGDLGTFGRGQMVGAFERAVFALKPGEISEVVESPFGFHVIQRYK